MAQQQNSKGELRAAFTMRELENAKRSCQTSTPGTFIRVALGIVFMYLIVISHLMLGAVGPVFISALFLVAFFVPYLYQIGKDRLERRRQRKEQPSLGRETTQEG